MSPDQDIPITPLEKKRSKRKILSLAFIFAVGVVGMFILSTMLSPLSTTVRADFGTPMFTDCYITNVNVQDNDSELCSWTYPDGGAKTVAVGDWVETVNVVVWVNVSRLATSGSYYSHMNVTLLMIDDISTETTYYDSTPFLFTHAGDQYMYVYTFNHIHMPIDSAGVYRLSTTYSIELP